MRALRWTATAVLLMWLVACANPSANSAARPDDETEAGALEQKWVDPEIRRDAVAVAELLNDQFLFVVGAGPPIDKAQFVKAVPSFTSTSQVLSEQVARIAGDTALIAGRDTLEGIGRDGKH